jgi:hypothetical protein
MDAVSNWIDKHIRIVRMVPYVIGGIGAYIVIRNYHLFTRFRSVSSIPQQLFDKNSTLYGKVRQCYGDRLEVWHIPLGYRLLKPRLPPSKDFLTVRFSGITIPDPAAANNRMMNNLSNSYVYFTLLYRSQEAVESIVYLRSKIFSFRKTSINELLIKEGLGVIHDVRGFHSNQEYSSFVSNLTRGELHAKNRGRGLWEGTEYEKNRWKFLRLMKKKIKRKQ